MNSVIMVFLGGGLGAVARYGVNQAALARFGPELPWGTLTVNVVGSLAMGMLWAVVAAQLDTFPVEVRVFLATGFLGGFTTFSAFSLDAFHLWQRGDAMIAVAYAAASVALSVGALAVGFALVRATMATWQA